MRLPTAFRILTPTLIVALRSASVGAQSPVGVFDGQTDIGHARGSASYDPQRQSYMIAGSGQNIWGDHDDFHFVWKRMTGNFILSTRARFVGAGVEAHRKIGWMIRPSLETSSAHVSAALHGNGLMSLQFRRTIGATTEEVRSRDSLPDADAVIQLERRDGVYLMSVARFGDTLATQELAGVSLPDTVYVGLFVCAHNDTVVERAAFSNVRITTPAKADLVRYRDYLGSNLEILDVASGNSTIVHQYRGSFQAPNWTPDGKALIYAQDGLLYRFDLASRSAEVINTAFANRNNNDHVLSFDGRMLGISNQAPEDSGRSVVYTVPVTGGTPTRVTAKSPSYLHGWSPDGRWLVFTGQRNGDFDVYKIAVARGDEKIPVTGGDEIRLTTAPGLDDGPEFTPDGTYIYFNSARTGRMQVWRMRPDGSEQQQITNDGFNNWFPHISPDGKTIAYIAFRLDVAADDHPFYKHVQLKLMPVGGGPARVIAYVYGGQGTINVPSWSPDGTKLAFVSNTTMPAPSSTIVAPPAQTKTTAERLGYPANAKLLILHGDDLGAAHSIDAATFDALDKGAVTSASIMMPTPWVTEVAAYAKAHPNADLGLHLTLTAEWETYRWGSIAPSDKVSSLLDSAGTFPNLESLVAKRAKPAEVERELRAQVERALALGIHPTHLDSHMGSLYGTPELMATLVKVAHDYRLPFRAIKSDPRTGAKPPVADYDVLLDAVITASPDIPRDQWKAFYLKTIANLKPGLTEIIVHLGHDDSELQAVTVGHEGWGSAWRQRDYDVMNSPEFKKALRDNQVTLVTWKQVQSLLPQR
jgi:TolB protein